MIQVTVAHARYAVLPIEDADYRALADFRRALREFSAFSEAAARDGGLTPRLAGLDAGYLRRQLDDYANGRREHAMMRAVVRRLDDGDRAKVSAYYASLPATAAALPQTSPLYRARCAECHGASGEGVGPANPPLAGQPRAEPGWP